MFKVLENGITPTRGSKYSACVDLYASEDVIIGAGETAVVGLGVCIDIEYLRFILVDTGEIDAPMDEDGIILDIDIADAYTILFCSSHYFQLNLQNNLKAKGLISNTEIINFDYQDEIKVIIYNPICSDSLKVAGYGHLFINDDNDTDFKIHKGDKIAQITLLEHKSYLFDIQSNDVRDGGFGSTDGKE